MRLAIVLLIGLALCSPAAGARPVLWYPLETSATTQNDIGTAPQASGTLGGSAVMLSGAGPAGFSCFCLDLSAATTTGNYLDTTLDVQKIDAMPALTVTMWINLRADPAYLDCLISDMPGGSPPVGQGGWDLRIVNPLGGGSISASSFSLCFEVMHAESGYTVASSATSPAIGASTQWVFIAVTYAAQVQKFYKGSETASVTQIGNNTIFSSSDNLRDNSTPLRIGGSSSEPTVDRTPPAWIDDVRIYNTGLTQAQLDQVRLENIQMPNMNVVPGFFSIGDLPGGSCSSRATAVSADGTTVVGYSSGNTFYEAYSWRNGVFTALGNLPGGYNSSAQAVSADGSTVVGIADNPYTNTEAFEWKSGVITDLGCLPGGDGVSAAYGVSADGNTIVGYSSDTPGGTRAVRWVGGVFDPIPYLPGGSPGAFARAISEDGTAVVGTSNAAVGYQAFRYESGVLTALPDLPGGLVAGQAYAISTDQQIVVGSGYAANLETPEATLWQGGRVWCLGDLPGGNKIASEALGVSAHGSRVVGDSAGTNNVTEAFLWDRVYGMRRLVDVLQVDYGLDLSYWAVATATGISRDGSVIVGWGRHPAGYMASWVAKLPACPAIGDFNADGHVDDQDLQMFADCAAGPGVAYFSPTTPNCQMAMDHLGLIPADLDWDGDVDMDDFAIFQQCYSGTEAPPDECRG